jgi:hypothetical protein
VSNIERELAERLETEVVKLEARAGFLDNATVAGTEDIGGSRRTKNEVAAKYRVVAVENRRLIDLISM